LASLGARGSASGVLEPIRFEIGGGRIDIRFGAGAFDVGRDGIAQWISDAAHAVTAYYGRFPVAEEVVEVQPVANKAGVFGGVTYNSTPARTEIEVGGQTSRRVMEDDWTMTHELTHLSFPNVPRRHHWIEEGIATYVEPIARAQAGTLGVEKVWAGMLHDMHKGEPSPDSHGLDQDHSWASTYWGGALFCLVADVQFRERTGNRSGLQDALRGILAAGGNIQADWPIARALETGDKAAGVPVLQELYSQAKDKPFNTDLARLWQRLGVSAAGSGVSFDQGAELSAIRLAITAKRS
jgi:hypothetical protein